MLVFKCVKNVHFLFSCRLINDFHSRHLLYYFRTKVFLNKVFKVLKPHAANKSYTLEDHKRLEN